MRLMLSGLTVALGLLLVSGCTWAVDLDGAEKAFYEGEVARAEDMLKQLERKTGDEDYPLVMLYLGSAELSLGDYRQAQTYFQAAIANLEAELDGLGIAAQVLRSEGSRLYRGFPHEKVLAHTYLGLVFIQRGQLNDARIEFAKASEEDRGKDAAEVDDFAPAHFLDGLRALRAEDYQYARVSFRRVIELLPEFDLGWYGLARASSLDGDEGEAGDAWRRYESMTDPSRRLARDGSTPCAIFLVDVGWGPSRSEDPVLREFALWEERAFPERKVALAAAGSPASGASLAGDTYFQAKTTGGFTEDLKKKVVSKAAKQALASAIPGAGLFLRSEADTRAWATAPGHIYFVALPLPSVPSTVELTAWGEKGNAIPIDTQVMYYIAGRPYDEAQIIYVRVLANADYREWF